MFAPIVPSFYLYGEPHRAISDEFVHVERLDDRSRPSEWTIQPHAHADLHHCFLIREGGGIMRVEERQVAFVCPVMMLVPATVVHGFDWEQESTGWVATMARGYLSALTRRHDDLARQVQQPCLLHLSEAEATMVEQHMATLKRELGWSAKGHSAAVDATVLQLLVLSLRAVSVQDAGLAAPPSPAAALVARFRERVEARFQLREKISDHARALHVSESSLRAACIRIARTSPAAILDERAMLEARRALLYTNMTVAQVGYALGFNDPAYFSRFFTRHAGMSPIQFRQRRRERS
ncbi:MAG: helix-turn-helix domain-containing protein [Sphingobium sp.]